MLQTPYGSFPPHEEDAVSEFQGQGARTEGCLSEGKERAEDKMENPANLRPEDDVFLLKERDDGRVLRAEVGAL